MRLDDNQRRFVAILNKKVEVGKLMNALGHMSAGLAGNYPDVKEMYFLKYEDKDGGAHPNISHFPFIVLKADNSNQIRDVRNKLLEMDLPFTDFTSTMTAGTSDEQQQRTKETAESELDYWGICFFGESEELRSLTKKFSLFN